jgi:hypothetical protein
MSEWVRVWRPMSRSIAHPPASHQCVPHPAMSLETSSDLKGSQTPKSVTAIR